MNAIANPDDLRRLRHLTPAEQVAFDASAAEHDRLARNRAHPDGRPVMTGPPAVTHEMARPAFPAVSLAVAVHQARQTYYAARFATSEAKGKRTKAEAREREKSALAALNVAQGALNRELAGGETARMAEMERRGLARMEFRDDPDDKNERAATPQQVRGARRVDPLRDMRDRGTVTLAQWRAAEAFRDDLALAAGARLGAPNLTGVRSADGAAGPAAAQLDAQWRVREAWRAIGLTRSGVVSWCVVSYGTLDGYARAKRVRRQTAGDMLQAALDDLDRFYDRKPEPPRLRPDAGGKKPLDTGRLGM